MARSRVEEEFIFDIAIGLAGPKSPSTTDHTDFRVPETIRSKCTNDAFTPQVISIGKIHHREKHFWAMERHKKQYTKSLLQRTQDDKDVLREWFSTTTTEQLEDDRWDFPLLRDEKMLHDACFIFELFIRSYEGDIRDDDPILADPRTSQMVRRDLALLENQIPFIVLKRLVGMIEDNYEGEYDLPSLIDLALRFFKLDPSTYKRCRKDFVHLTDLIHDYYVSSFPKSYPRVQGEWKLMKCATKLSSEYGIEFRRVATENILDVKFGNGIFTIPQLCVEKSVFQNLIALEQCWPDREHYMISYGLLMDYLIDTKEDAELLVEKGIIPSSFGACEEVAHLFNNICKQIVLRSFYYAKLCEDVDAYCNSPWMLQKHVSSLVRDYCKSPWAVLGIIAATIILVLTLLQTIYTMKNN